jgi:hypothetical protein
MKSRAAVAFGAGKPPRLAPFVPLTEINEAFDLMHQGKSIRSVVHFGRDGHAA